MRKVSKNSPVPLYYQLKEIIQELIENDILKPGDPIPTERELSELHGISRVTVRKSITSLVYEGYLYSEHGKGTFVTEPKAVHTQYGIRGFTEMMTEKGVNHETRILDFQIKEATKTIRERLQLPEHENKVFEIKRLRIADGEPMILEKEIIPYHLCPSLKREMVEGNSLYDIFRKKYNFNFKRAEQIIEPIILNEYESSLLKQKEETIALLIRRRVWLDDGRIMAYTKATYRSEKYKYKIIFEE